MILTGTPCNMITSLMKNLLSESNVSDDPTVGAIRCGAIEIGDAPGCSSIVKVTYPSLPCPCNGLFGNPKGSYCLQRLLVDFPIETVSSVQLSVKSKLPFSSIWEKDQNYHLNLKVIRDRDSYVEGLIEMEGDASCSSISGTGKSENVSERDLVLRNESDVGLGVVNSSLHVKEGRFDLKGKGIINQRPRSGLRRSRKRVTDFGKVSSVSSENPSCADAQSPFSIIHKGGEEIELSSVPFDSGVDANRFHYDEEDHVMGNIVERASHGFDLIEPFDEDKPAEKNASFEEIKSNAQRELDFDGNEKNAIRILEQALEEEQAARAALYLGFEIYVLGGEDLFFIVVFRLFEAGIIGVFTIVLPGLLERVQLGLELVPLFLGFVQLAEQPVVIGIGDFK
ncbi:uncharacterized protein LOC114275535 [Camellia sinensis]|uniref:uncharacterized protein LOC114275535 n=1 Tax=Camellia sinensis TaxID=4442 RepID=UPI001035C7EC|nr:uncharacterized protein LOC114275535 [Camellia sinensis]